MKEYSSTRPSNPHRGDTMHEQRLARAIDYQTKVVEHLQRLPLIQEVADHVGVCDCALSLAGVCGRPPQDCQDEASGKSRSAHWE